VASLGTVFVDVKMDDNQVRGESRRVGLHAADELGRSGTSGGKQAGDHFVSSLRTSVSAGPLRAVGAHIGTSLLAGFTAVGVAAGIGKVLTTGFGEVSDYQKGLAQLQAGLKSTGGVAGITAGHMEDLASKIQSYSGQTDDSIVATEQLLLTFTNIRDVAGKNNDVFTQTTTIAADMAARLGGDASSAAIQLGKALNDPVKGITALTRVGVSFSDAQKKAIGDDVKRNDLLGAQKVILAELTKEFGGSAKAVGETLPGQVQRAKRSFEDFSQSIVGAIAPLANGFLPLLQKGLDSIGPKLQSAAQQLPEIINVFKTSFQTHGNDVTTQGFLGSIGNIGMVARNLFDGVKSGIQDLVSFFKGSLVPSFQNVAAVLKGPLEGAVVGIIGSFRIAADILKTYLGPALVAVTGFMRQHQTLVKTVAIIIGTMVLAWKAWQTAIKVWEGITKAAIAVQAAFNVVMDANPIALVVIAIAGLAAGLVYAYKNSETFRTIVKDALHVVEVAFYAVSTAAQAAFGWIKDHWKLLVQIIGLPFEPLVQLGLHFQFFEGIAKAALRAVADHFLGMVGTVLHTASSLFGWVPTVGDKLKSASAKFDAFRDDVNNALGGINENKQIKVTATAVLNDGSGSPISDSSGYSLYARGHAAGGPITGPGTGTSDSIMARLSNGEYVVKASAASQHRELLDAINYGAPRFANGGPVVSASADAAGFGRQVGAWDNSLTSRVTGAFSSMVSRLASTFTASVGGGTARWLPVVLQALALNGVPSSWASRVLAQIQFESGGDPNIHQQVIDINTFNGSGGAQGLMQVLYDTFIRNHVPGTSMSIFDPLANVAAGVRHAIREDPGGLSYLGQGHGYDKGGRWPSGTLGWNTSGKDEFVVTGDKMDRLLNLMERQNKLLAANPGAIVGGLNGAARGSRLDARTRTR
jgi:hypothetical protein